MAITLSAEQKSIRSVFESTNKYIIPSYQRPYSWDIDDCLNLWDDLWYNFNNNREEGYFLGNIVLAKNDDILEIIDGQQRLVTLTLFLKAIFHFDNKNKAIRTAIWDEDIRDENIKKLRIQTKVFEHNDSGELEVAIKIESLSDACKKKKKENNFKDNLCFFYKKLEDINQDSNIIMDFADYLLKKVYLLPIVTSDQNEEKARAKALTIFETINNRGQDLSDADIFKAQLYNLALNDKKSDEFIEEWRDLLSTAKDLKYTIIKVFRIYTYILRGQHNEKGQELSMRDFFIKNTKNYSNLKQIGYEQVLEDLNRILLCIDFFSRCRENRLIDNNFSKLSSWFQILDSYPNAYPNYIIFVYLYKHGKIGNDGTLYISDIHILDLISLSKNIIKLAYLSSQAMSIKFRVFEIMVLVSKGKLYSFNEKDNKGIKKEDFDFLNENRKIPRRKGLMLLHYYLHHENKILYPYYLEQLINASDYEQNKELVSQIGNYIVLNKKIGKRNLLDKLAILRHHNDDEISSIATSIMNNEYKKIKERSENIVNSLVKFFQEES